MLWSFSRWRSFMCFSSSFCFSAMASNTAHVPLFSNLIRQQSLCGKASSRTYFLWTCPPTFQETPSYTCTMGPRPTPEQLVLTLVASWGHNALWTPEKNWILDFKKEERWRYFSFTCIYRAIWSRGGGGSATGCNHNSAYYYFLKSIMADELVKK